MNPIFQALNSNYGPEEILQFLSKAIPQFSTPIKKASSSGYNARQILGFLSKNFDEDRRGMSQSQIIAANRRSDAESTKHGLQMAATAFAAPIASAALGNALSRSLPNNLKNLSTGMNQQAGPSSAVPPSQTLASGLNPAASPGQNIDQTTLQQPQGTPLQSTASQQPPINTDQLQQTESLTQPQEVQQPEVKSIDLSKYAGFTNQIDKLMQSGNGPNEIAGYFQKFNPGQTKKLEKEFGQPIDKIIESYISSKPQVPNESATVAHSENSALPGESLLDVQKRLKTSLGESIKLIKDRDSKDQVSLKNTTVASPLGIGEVKEIRNGKALIDIDGKKHQVNEDELIQSPIPEKDLADLYDEVLEGIKKHTGQEVSRNVEWAGYDPKTNELAYKPHSSDKLYAYADISPEDVELLTSLLTQRKTTGENFIGAWEAGTTSPIGAAMFQLIQKLQKERGGKGNEYKNRYETIYDALEPAKKARKEKYAEAKRKAKKPRSNKANVLPRGTRKKEDEEED